MFVSETNPNSGAIDSEVNIPGYTLLRLDCKNLRSTTFGVGGVDMYIKNNIPFLTFSIPTDKEVLQVEVNLPKNVFVIGTFCNSTKVKIINRLEDCLKLVKQRFPKSGIKINVHHDHWLKSRSTVSHIDAEGLALLELLMA